MDQQSRGYRMLKKVVNATEIAPDIEYECEIHNDPAVPFHLNPFINDENLEGK